MTTMGTVTLTTVAAIAAGAAVGAPLRYLVDRMVPDRVTRSASTCGKPLNGSRAFFHALGDGLLCGEDKRLASSEISSESRALAAQMFRSPVESFSGAEWPKGRAADLRKFLMQALERQLEKKFVTPGMLEKSGA